MVWQQGALGRFINHSCEPNCETQKWVVRGELAIGLFAMQDIPAGVELTFDYNFERYGDKVTVTSTRVPASFKNSSLSVCICMCLSAKCLSLQSVKGYCGANAKLFEPKRPD